MRALRNRAVGRWLLAQTLVLQTRGLMRWLLATIQDLLVKALMLSLWEWALANIHKVLPHWLLELTRDATHRVALQ